MIFFLNVRTWGREKSLINCGSLPITSVLHSGYILYMAQGPGPLEWIFLEGNKLEVISFRAPSVFVDFMMDNNCDTPPVPTSFLRKTEANLLDLLP